ncbi:ATP-binding cassette sub-family D member 4 [Micractinium conductrix]|uniref:ATP-binding cassette sub-family D member 4 n=1 Tax=Micractinium conductrix TaxID=554055 RepID=A0A2P6VH28_9CHLO|nr:ATP-binding cassette sub-family D member 4 [Micractinium conductrix]|eukprot:PSC73387.1 ATP-binding cassette sub-family D member 4 [Micractinium conductrix]
MQIVSPGAIDAAAAEPLLSRPHAAAAAGGNILVAAHAPSDPAPEPAKALQPQPLHFRRRFAALLALLRPWPALALSALAIIEALVVAEVGKVAGSFYKIVVDRQPSQLAAAMVHAGALYAACTALYSASCWVTETLALRWRRRLTRHLHRRYCQDSAFYTLARRQQQQQRQQREGEAGEGEQQQETARLLGPHGAPGSGALAQQQAQQQQQQQQQGRQAGDTGVPADNPDQRIAADAAALCDCLSAVVRVAAAAPFKLLYYSWLTWGYLGWSGLGVVYAFFWAAGLVQRLAVAPVSRLVAQQERHEGDLRFAHLRLREYSSEVAQYGGAAAERAHLDGSLEAALTNQRRLVTLRTVLAAATRAVDYAGALLNYLVVGAAVFTGMAGSGKDSGELAQFVSNASFATLMLIYTVTELLDLSDQLSRMGGLTARVGQLLEDLPTDTGPAAGAPAGDMHAVRVSLDGRELQPSSFAALLQPPRQYSCLGGLAALEVSLHQLGPDLRQEARAIFPDAPDGGQILAAITFQFAADDVSLAPGGSTATLERAAAEMDRMLHAFLRWEAALSSLLAKAGFWCDAIDPRTGMALHGRRGTRWSEVAAAHALLGYERRVAGICPVVLHPRHGTSAYPATLFTDASSQLLSEALASLADGPPAVPAPAPDAPPLLALRHLSVRTPAGGLAVDGLNLELRPGQHLLIAGPNGCGKSTLLKALCGVHPLQGGSVQLPPAGGDAPGSGVVFVPQRPLVAPGGALWQQLCYPGGCAGSLSSSSGDGPAGQQQAAAHSSGSSSQQHAAPARPRDSELLAVLQLVGLQYLLNRVGGSFEAAADWAAMLSPGELQRLSVARVLLRRPPLAVLDEVTSAVSEAAAAALYGELHAAGVTCVSIGQDSEHLRRLHPLRLRLGCGPTAAVEKSH